MSLQSFGVRHWGLGSVATGISQGALIGYFPQTYYASPSGSDSNAGTTPDAPWQTNGKINSASLLPGDTVLKEMDGEWTDASLVPKAGVTYGFYGTGVRQPVDHACQNMKGTTWSDFGGTRPGTYQATIAGTRNPTRLSTGRRSGTLGTNPFTTKLGSPIVIVELTGHNARIGSSIRFINAPVVNGIAMAGLKKIEAILDANHVTFRAFTLAEDDGSGGGSGIVYDYTERAPSRIGALSDVSIDITGTAGVTWTNAEASTGSKNPNIWMRTYTVSAGAHPEAFSLNGSGIVKPKLSMFALDTQGDMYIAQTGGGTTARVWIYSTTDPASAYTSIWSSTLWFSSLSGGTITVTLFNPGTNPSNDPLITEIWINGFGNDRLDINVPKVTIRGIDFWGAVENINAAPEAFGHVLDGVRCIWAHNNGSQRSADDALAIDCDFSENGQLNSQGNFGDKIGSTGIPLVRHNRLIRCYAYHNGEDGLATQTRDGSQIIYEDCFMVFNDEDGQDHKGSGTIISLRGYANKNRALAFTLQADCRAVLDQNTFIGGTKLNARTKVIGYKNIFSAAQRAGLFCNDTGTSGARDGNSQIDASIMETRTAGGGIGAVELCHGDHRLRHPTIHNLHNGATSYGLEVQPNASVTTMDVVIENGIIMNNGSGADAFVVNRNAASSLTNITITLLETILWRGTLNTSWAQSETTTPTKYTEANVDSDQTGLLVITNTAADPTVDPLCTNPYKGGLATVTSGSAELLGIYFEYDCADYSIGENLWEIPYDNPSRAFTRGAKAKSSSGGVAYIRDVFPTVLIVSELDGSWNDDDTLTDERGGLAQQNGAMSNPMRLVALNVDGQTVNLTAGNLVTTTGKSARLINQQDGGATARLTLLWDPTTDAFADNDVLSDGTGNGNANGAQMASPAKASVAALVPAILKDRKLVDYENVVSNVWTQANVSQGALKAAA